MVALVFNTSDYPEYHPNRITHIEDSEANPTSPDEGSESSEDRVRLVSDNGNLVPEGSKAIPKKKRPAGSVPDATNLDKAKRGPITICAGHLDRIVKQAEIYLRDKKTRPIYQRGEFLVQPVLAANGNDSTGRIADVAYLKKLTRDSLVFELAQSINWQKYDARTEEMKLTDPTGQIANLMLEQFGHWTFNPVAGVITCPTMRGDGSILDKPGYDQATRLYLMCPDGLRLTDAVHNPSREDALRSLARLKDLVREAPFAGEPKDAESNRAVALSAMITPVIRAALPVAPLHAVSANGAGSGKSHLVDMASYIATGAPLQVTRAADPKEMDKGLTGLLLEGVPLISIDNVNGELGTDLLCQAVERPSLTMRALGGSSMRGVVNCACMFATGNNLRLVADMVRRSVRCDLDARMEDPYKKKYSSDPIKAIMADRGGYISDCLIIARAYILAGRPNPITPLASFAEWSRTVREALVWLGEGDPCATMEKSKQDDPERGKLLEMLGLWEEAIGANKPVTVTQAVDIAEEDCASRRSAVGRDGCERLVDTYGTRFPEFKAALIRLSGDRGKISTSTIGRWLRDRQDILVESSKFVKAGSTRAGVALWKLDNTTPPF